MEFKIGQIVTGIRDEAGNFTDSRVPDFIKAIEEENNRRLNEAFKKLNCEIDKIANDLYGDDLWYCKWNGNKKIPFFESIGLIPFSVKGRYEKVNYNWKEKAEMSYSSIGYSGSISDNGDVSIHEDIDESPTGRTEVTVRITKPRNVLAKRRVYHWKDDGNITEQLNYCNSNYQMYKWTSRKWHKHHRVDQQVGLSIVLFLILAISSFLAPAVYILDHLNFEIFLGYQVVVIYGIIAALHIVLGVLDLTLTTKKGLGEGLYISFAALPGEVLLLGFKLLWTFGIVPSLSEILSLIVAIGSIATIVVTFIYGIQAILNTKKIDQMKNDFVVDGGLDTYDEYLENIKKNLVFYDLNIAISARPKKEKYKIIKFENVNKIELAKILSKTLPCSLNKAMQLVQNKEIVVTEEVKAAICEKFGNITFIQL